MLLCHSYIVTYSIYDIFKLGNFDSLAFRSECTCSPINKTRIDTMVSPGWQPELTERKMAGMVKASSKQYRQHNSSFLSFKLHPL